MLYYFRTVASLFFANFVKHLNQV